MFDNKKSEEDEQDMFDESITFLDSMEHPFQAQKKLVTAVLVDAGLFLSFFLGSKLLPYYVTEGLEDTYFLLILVLFAVGFLIGYALFMLFQIHYSSKTNVNIETGLMSGYSHADKNSRKLQLYFFASFCGILNIGIFLILSKII